MNQPHKTLQAEHGGKRFCIAHDPPAGFYLYVYDGERCTHDYLQDTLADAQEFARETFGVPIQIWSHEQPTV
jgi:hypothetical protein